MPMQTCELQCNSSGKICHIWIFNKSTHSGQEIIKLISFSNPIGCLLSSAEPFWRLPSCKTVTFVKANLYFISLYFMDTRFPLIYLFSPITQIAHLHPSLWQQQPWHSWLPEAKDSLRLNIWVPVVNPRWMRPACTYSPCRCWALAEAAQGAQVWLGCCQCLLGRGSRRACGSVCPQVRHLPATVAALGLFWLHPD